MDIENVFVFFIRLVVDRSDFAGSFNGNVAFYEISVGMVIKLIWIRFFKFKKNGNGKTVFFRRRVLFVYSRFSFFIY